MSKNSKAAGKCSQIRIIAGQWRGSRVDVLDKKGLRPTPDRIRETLFNWLAMDVPRSNVLDCFAGAGGLGLGAASREAKRVTLVDKDRYITANLTEQCNRLGATNTSVITDSVLNYLDSTDEVFDIVFIDPPYAMTELRSEVLKKLIDRQLLSDEALIYLEWPKEEKMELTYSNLIWVKQKTSGKVSYAIAQWRVTG